MTQAVLIDGCNLDLGKGAGIAAYARSLSHAAHELGYRVDVLCGLRTPSTPDALLQDAFFPHPSPQGVHRHLPLALDRLKQVARAPFGHRAREVLLSDQVIAQPFSNRLPYYDQIWNSPDIFGAAHAYFNVSGRFLPTRPPEVPRIAHWTCPVPIHVPSAKNIYTLHDLVPLKLPYTAPDRTRAYRELIRAIVERADQSERSKQDICELFDVPEEKITNTSQTVSFPEGEVEKPIIETVHRELDRLFGLAYRGYFLFYGSIEPRNNVGRLIEAYLATNMEAPS